MPTFKGTARNDSWTIVNPGNFTLDGLSGLDTTFWGTSRLTDYNLYLGSLGEVRLDSISSASASLEATLYNIEKMVFDSGREVVDLRVLFPTAVAELIVGTASNDALYSTNQNNGINGAAGVDTVNFSLSLANYTIANITKFGPPTYTIKDKTGTDGTDTLQNIEVLKFSDKSINLTIQAQAKAASAADVTRLSELYIAFFNRVPDADGLSYWIGQKAGGLSINQIAETFYNAGVQYSSLTGFSASMSNTAFIDVIYKNVLGRAEGADAGGLAYWNAKLVDGSATRGSLVSTILDSAHTFKGNKDYGYVADLLDNKIAVAQKFAIDWGLSYNTANDSITNGMAIAASVTPTSTAAAIALIGVTPGDVVLV
jgi:hypothetical protein